jgi:hypothetical protein
MLPMVAVLVLVLLAGCSSKGSGSTAASTKGSTSPSTTSGGASNSAGTCGTTTTVPGGAGTKEVTPPGDIPDTVKFVDYTPPSGRYTIKYPESFGRAEAGDAVTFTDKFNSIKVELVAAPQAPTAATAQSTEVPKIAAATRCFEAGKVSTVTRKAGPAVLITYRADSPPDAVTGKIVRQDAERYEFWKPGLEAVITLSAPVGSDNVDPWKTVTDAFAWR